MPNNPTIKAFSNYLPLEVEFQKEALAEEEEAMKNAEYESEDEDEDYGDEDDEDKENEDAEKEKVNGEGLENGTEAESIVKKAWEEAESLPKDGEESVSYTHLTLPTIYSV